MKIIGTAGHVDHGKSTLIAALTGIHPDRLKEEQEREMTIELGFGWLTLPNGQEVGIIDVPGHRDFIGNMLAGIGGIDMVMLVIAADEGVMPQTKEHLAIIDLLQIKQGLVVITKTDLVDDSDWLEMVEGDIRKTLIGTCLETAPFIKVSARKKEGITNLLQQIESTLSLVPERIDKGKPRLPVDRVFTMPGFGTVVTGTLSDGCFSVGDDVVSLPLGDKGKIRGLQTHKKKEDISAPGSRTAINISGIHIDDIERGHVICHPGTYSITRRIDCTIKILAEEGITLKNNTEVKIYLGSSETIGNCRLLNVDELSAGEQGYAQIELAQPVVANRGDRLIIRRPSPSETIGGGTILDPTPTKRHKRFDETTLSKFETLLAGDPQDIVLVSALASGITTTKELIKASGLTSEVAQEAIQECIAIGTLVILEEANGTVTLIARSQLEIIIKSIEQVVSEYHSTFPLRKGIPKEELKSKLKLQTRNISLILQKTSMVDSGSVIHAPDFVVQFDPSQKAKIESFLADVNSQPYSPPSVKDVRAVLGDELYNALIDQGMIEQVSNEVFFLTATFTKMVNILKDTMTTREFSVSEVRDLFGNSRKYALAFCEYLDKSGITIREGDQRKIKQ